MTISFDEESLQRVAEETVNACLRCVDDFAHICDGDQMINFEVPTQMGIGVTRGIACCLIAGETVLDYSGHILNLAARLTDIARPSGVVLDGNFGIQLLPTQVQERFQPDEAYLPGVAEDIPCRVYTLRDAVEIPNRAKHPLRYEHWKTFRRDDPAGEWRKMGPIYQEQLEQRLVRPDAYIVEVIFDDFIEGQAQSWHVHRELEDVEYVVRGDEPWLVVQMDEMHGILDKNNVPDDAKVIFRVKYVPSELFP